jgi:alpha-glucosidase (family GH31 glycosyl hydrolase)
VAGFPFTGGDIPGFFGSPVPDDLIIDFFKMGAWFPLMKAHSHIDTIFRDLWFYTERVQAEIKNAILQRYSFIHYM